MYEFKNPYQDPIGQYYKSFTLFTQAGTGVIGKVLLNYEAWCHFSGYFSKLCSKTWSAEN